MPLSPRALVHLLLVAVVCGCGGAGSPAAPGPASCAAADAGERDLHIAEAIHAESIWPVEKRMCRSEISGGRCREACRATHELREVSARACRRGSAAECGESRALAKRADTTCSFCSGEMIRRPCHDLF